MAPGRCRPGFLCNRLEERPPTLATVGIPALRPTTPEPGKTKNPRRACHPVLRRPGLATAPPDRAGRPIRIRPADDRTAKPLTPCGAEQSNRPARVGPPVWTPAFRPRHPLPAKRATAGLNDALPKEWRSFRRCCFRRLATAGPLRNRCPPGRCWLPYAGPALPPHVALPVRRLAQGLKGDNNNRQVKLRKLWRIFLNLHISRTLYPPDFPRRLTHSWGLFEQAIDLVCGARA